MAALVELCDYTDGLLHSDDFDDYCPNGLQVEGAAEVRRLVSGVTASQALLEAAVAHNADAVLVHHGYFWRGEDARVRGVKKARLQTLLSHDISLLAYHLPLDAHPTLGNNAQLALRLSLSVDGVVERGDAARLLWYGTTASPMPLSEFSAHVGRCLQRAPTSIGDGHHMVHRVAWCTGAAQGFIESAAALGVDAFVSGEISEPTVHFAREAGIAYVAAGHHATERYGAAALGEHLADRFDLAHQFIDVDNPA